jgi:replicative DNA helicase
MAAFMSDYGDKTVTGSGYVADDRPYRQLPHNLEAEQGLLGALMVDNSALEKIDFLKPHHFFAPAHQRIFDAIQKVAQRGQTASPVTLKAYFETDADLKSVGGAAYLADLAASVVTVINAPHYATTLLDLHRRRELVAVAEKLCNDAFSPDLDVMALDLVTETEEKLYQLAGEGLANEGPKAIRHFVDGHLEAIDRAGKGERLGVKTGLAELDRVLKALRPGRLYTLAGRTAMGKSALALCIAHNAARAKNKGLYISLEMEGEELTGRLIARQTGIPTSRQEEGLSPEDFRRVSSAATELRALTFKIDQKPGLTLGQIRSFVRREIRSGGLDLLVVDHLTLMGDADRGVPLRERVGFNTKGLKNLAKDFNIPVVLLAQVNRGVESRDNKRPGLADLKESGSIEEDSDCVMFIYRDEYYLEHEPEPTIEPREKAEEFSLRLAGFYQRKLDAKGKAEIIIAKNRGGQLATVRVKFDGSRQSFDDLDVEGPRAYSGIGNRA